MIAACQRLFYKQPVKSEIQRKDAKTAKTLRHLRFCPVKANEDSVS